MTTLDFINQVLDWELADPTHIITTAGAFAALTPTPDPNSPIGKLYKLIEIFALNFLHAKDTGNNAKPPQQ